MRASPPERSAGTVAARVVYLGEHARFHGGGETSLIELAAGMAAAGLRPLVLIPGPGPLAARCVAAGVPWEAFHLPRLRHPIALAAAVVRLARRLRGAGADVVHTGGPRAALVAGLACRVAGAAHVFHVRASRADRGPGDRLLHLLSDRVIAVSRAAARRSAVLAASTRMRVVPTGVAPAPLLDRAAARSLLGVGPGGMVFGVIGRVERDKGCDTILAAWPAIRSARPGSRLVFVGAVRAECAGRAARAAGPEVLFAGDHPGAARLLRAFDLLVHAARHEALPRVLIEAALAGVPAVATRVGGVPEILPDGECALLVEPDDPGALAAAWLALAADPGLRDRLAGAAGLRAARLFAPAAMIRGVRQVYDELLQDRVPAARAAEARGR